MSGPKAVRVVSREERVARCLDLLAILDAQVAEWLRVGNKLGVISAEDRSGTEAKVSLLHKMYAEDSFDQVEVQTRNVIDFLSHNLDEKIAKQAEKKHREKTARRRLVIASEQLLSMVEAAQHDLNPMVTKVLESAANGSVSNASEVERSINEAVTVLSSTVTSKELTNEQRELAVSLKGNMKVQTITAWVIETLQFNDDLATKAEGYVASLEVTEGSDVSEPFAKRMEEIRTVSNRRRRRMLLDTLIINLAAEVKDRKRKRKLYTRAISLKARIERDIKLSHQINYRLENLLERWDNVDSSTAENTLEEVTDIIEQLERKLSAKFTRSALLEAFSELGYEIREGIETALVEDKKIVVRKSEQLDYGVEVSRSVKGNRFQVRPVRFSTNESSADKDKDLDIETTWCSEFGELREILDRNGDEIVIERAIPVGEMPVKVVTVSTTRDSRDNVARPIIRERPVR